MASHPARSDSKKSKDDTSTQGQKRKRLPRALLACESCRSRKLRCDQLTPCTNCAKRSLRCEYRSLEIPLPSAATRSNGNQQDYTAIAGSSYDDPIKRRSSSITSLSGVNSSRMDNLPGPINYLSTPTQSEKRTESATAFPNTSTSGQPVEAESGFEEVNRHTHGTEYYGPVSLFSFLRRLRSRAHNQRLRTVEKPETRNTRDARDMSIVNLLHSSDFPVTSLGSSDDASPEQGRLSMSHQATSSRQLSPSPTQSALSRPQAIMPSAPVVPFPRLSNQDIERECVRLYFLNLHNVHPILDQPRFIERCETEIWNRAPDQEPVQTVFLALFNAVLAVGAINAGEDASFMHDTTSVRQAERYAGGPDRKAPTYPPLKLAKLFFERAKTNLGDVFEACSLESTQTLLLMAVFCQNALKPHSCYLCCGMAVRGALAIGLPNYTGPDVVRASTTWWGLYSFEIEMCAAAGRESSLREPRQYRIPLPHIAAPDDPKQLFHTQMITLAQIVAELSQETTDPDFNLLLPEKSRRCLEIDRKLVDWKNKLPSSLDWDSASLIEPEWVSKQKVVLRNRFLNTRLLIHRPFLIAASSETSSSSANNRSYGVHVAACVAASVRTIEALYEMYKHRPYFRTWWYNTTYTLYASMVLLYVILSNIDIGSTSSNPSYSRTDVIRVVQQSIEIFQAMDMVTVARRCIEVTQEVLEIAKRSPPQGATYPIASTASASPDTEPKQTTTSATINAGFDTRNFPSFDNCGLDFLVDPNLMEGLGPYPGIGRDGSFEFLDFNSVLASGPFT